MSDTPSQPARAPVQERSRVSFERVARTVLELLTERGDADVTIAEISDRSGVSIGAIYGRVGRKAGLLRVVHAREMDRIDALTRLRLGSTGLGGAATDRIDAVVLAFVTLFREIAPILRPFIALANDDDAIAERGRASGDESEALFVAAIERACSPTRVDAERAKWCFDLVYSVLARLLGLGVTPQGMPGAPTPDWEALERNLCRTVRLCLEIK